jgi:hypothetical protein
MDRLTQRLIGNVNIYTVNIASTMFEELLADGNDRGGLAEIRW